MVTVKIAKTRREIRQFVLFPVKLYKNDPYYVPDMVGDQINDLMPHKNPAFEYCEARCFLVYKEGKIVGRVAGILNKRANEKNNVNYLRFAFFDFIDDAEVTDALYAALADYAKELGCVAIHGPQGFSDMDREGMLVEGFDRLSQFYVYYNHPYYLEHMARLGFVKEVDWVEFLIHIPDQEPEHLMKLTDRVRRHMDLTIRDLSDKKRLPQYLRDVFALYNEAYQVLRSAPRRALYLLALKGRELPLEATVQDPGFLLQQMQWREELEDLQDSADLDGVASFKRRLRSAQVELESAFATCWDDEARRDEAERLVRRMQVLDKLAQEVRQLEERLDD